MLDALTLDQMRVLAAVAQTGSFSAAARKLGRAQSAISHSVGALEAILGAQLFDRAGKTPVLTPVGGAILKEAQQLVDGARMLKLRAVELSDGLEPDLSFAIDAIFPNRLLIESLATLRELFPKLPVSVFTENLGGSEQRLRDGVVRFAIYPLLTTGARDLVATPFASLEVAAVVAAGHPLAALPGPLTREQLEPETQLVLTDRTPLTQNLMGGIISHNIWRFADLATRLEFLLAGFGWCRMPLHLVARHISEGRLKRINLAEANDFRFDLNVVHERGRGLGRAGRWLIDDLRRKLSENN